MNDKPLIDPVNMPMWTVSAFTLALIALVVAVVGFYRTNTVAVGTQMQAIMLNDKIEQQNQRISGASAAAAAVAAAPAKEQPAPTK